MQQRFVVIVIFFYSCFGAFAQSEKPMRIEIEAKTNADDYNIIPFGKKGILLFYQSVASFSEGNGMWIFSLYDVNFKEVWTKQYAEGVYMKLRLHDKDEDHLYLFLQKAVNKSQKDDFSIVTVNINTCEIKSTKGVNPDHSDVNSFIVMQDKAYCGGVSLPSKGAEIGQLFFNITLVPLFSGITLLHYQPSFFQVDLDNGQIKSSKEKFKGQAWVESMEADRLKNSVFLTLKNYIPYRKNFMYFFEYDSSGTKLKNIELATNNSKRKLNTAKLLIADDSTEIVIGTYNNKVKGYSASAANNAFKEPSTGIYFTQLVHGQQKFIRFFNFSELKSLVVSMNAKRTFRLKNKEARYKINRKEISFDYSLLLHNVIVKDNQYIFLAETYFPEYHNVSYTSYDAYGRPVTSTYTIFDGYRYSDAIIASFDKKGNLLWDNSFEMKDVLSMNLDERVEVMFSDDDIILTYSNEGEIFSKIIRGSEVIEGNSSTPIQTNYKNDKILSDYNSDMIYWYGDYFISYGYQRIKNNSPESKSKRTVFYFNKIGFY